MNSAGYVQNSFAFFDGHLRVDAGLRFDYFTFNVNGFELGRRDDGESPCNSDFYRSGNAGKSVCVNSRWQRRRRKVPTKVGCCILAVRHVSRDLLCKLRRGISSQDARGVIRNPDAPKISTTDFYQAGTSYNGNRVSLVLSSFLIDRSNEQLYIPDDGSIEFAGRSRSYGVEIRNSIRLNRFLSFNGGLTQVIRSYYPGEFTSDSPRRRIIVDSAPHTVANGGLVLSELRGFNAFLNWRNISSYCLDGEDPAIKAAGHDVVDLSLTKQLRKWVNVNFSIDNLLNKKYFETQNFFESRTAPGADVISRIHATPGYPFTISAGVTFRFGANDSFNS